MAPAVLALLLVVASAQAQEMEESWVGGGESPHISRPISTLDVCQACNVAVVELWRRVPPLQEDPTSLTLAKRREREINVYAIVEATFCAEGSFVRYDVSPVHFGRACKLFVERHNDEAVVEARLVKGVPGGHYFDFQSSVCKEACAAFPGVQHMPSDAKPYVPQSERGRAPPKKSRESL